MFMISEKGGIALSDSKQLEAAESLAAEVDSLVSDFTLGILSCRPEEAQREQLRSLNERYLKLDERAKSLELLGMEMLDGNWGKHIKKAKHLLSS